MKIRQRGMPRFARAAMLLGLLTVGYEAAAQGPVCPVAVHPSGDVDRDADAIATALNANLSGSVVICLHGTGLDGVARPFNFGQSESVVINPTASGDLTELTIVGVNGATIEGGRQPFSLYDTELESLRIENIRFRRPVLTAISIFDNGEDGHIEIADVVIEGVITGEITNVPNPPALLREGIAIVTPVSDIGGEIVIRNNVVDGGTYSAFDDGELTASVGILASGFGVAGSTNVITAEISIIGNTVTNWSGYGIQVIGVEDTIIRDNTIIPGSFANFTSFFGGCGASGIGLVNSVGGVVSNNVIEKALATTGSNGPPDCSAGLVLWAFNPSASADNSFVKNRISGEGTHALILPNSLSSVVDNVIFGSNNWSQFAPTEASIFLGIGAADNVIWAGGGTIAGPTIGDNIIRGTSQRGGRNK